MKEKSAFPYWNLEQEWGRQRYIDQCNLNKRNLLAWFNPYPTNVENRVSSK